MHITSQKQLTGRFNSHLKDALLVFCDEGVWGGDKSAEGTLKAMITEDFKPVEAKGKDLIMVQNFIRLIIASNNEWVVPVGRMERRFCLLDVSPIHLQDRAYFKALAEEMDNGGREAMLHDLLSLDISEFDFGAFPKTKALEEQFLRSAGMVIKFWHSRLMAGTLLDSEQTWKTDAASDQYAPVVTTQKLHASYLRYGQDLGDRYLESDSVFIRSLKKVCPEAKPRKITTPRDGRKTAYEFPDLARCRELFNKHTGFSFDWPRDDD
jgi:hypothetical protein